MENNENHNPGPGAYSPNFKSNQPSYNITMKSRSPPVRNSTNTPGPGSYSIASSLTNAHGTSLAGRTYIKNNEQSPSPCAYSPGRPAKTSSTTMGGRTYIPGTADWQVRKSASSPPPGAYNIPSMLNTKGCTLSSRTVVTKANENPGPGAYSPTNKSSAKISFSGRTNLSPSRDTVPGPGSYTLGSTLKKGGISMSGRPSKRGGMII